MEISSSDREAIQEILVDLAEETERHREELRSISLRIRYLLGALKIKPSKKGLQSPTGRKSKLVELQRQCAKDGTIIG